MLMIPNHVSIPELHQLLRSIIDPRPNVGIRFRLIGEMWQNNFLKVIRLEENAAIFYDERNDQNSSVSDIKRFMQFEIDSQFHQYQPNFHYTIETLASTKVK